MIAKELDTNTGISGVLALTYIQKHNKNTKTPHTGLKELKETQEFHKTNQSTNLTLSQSQLCMGQAGCCHKIQAGKHREMGRQGIMTETGQRVTGPAGFRG